MKKTNKKISKLNLNSQTIRALTDSQLGAAVGGVPPTSHINGSYCCTDAPPCEATVLPTGCFSQCWFC